MNKEEYIEMLIQDLKDNSLAYWNSTQDEMVEALRELQQENKQLKKQLETSNELVAQSVQTEMKLRDEINRLRKEYQDTYKDVRIEIKEYKTQKKELKKWLEEKIQRNIPNARWKHYNEDGFNDYDMVNASAIKVQPVNITFKEVLDKIKELEEGVK